MPMIDEGMTWAVSGQVSPLAAQLVFCRTVGTCYELGDYRRAAEWMDAIAECFIRTGIDSLPGDCETHSIGILIGRGAWSEAERRARHACAGMEPIELVHVGHALSEIGEIHLRMGDLDGAADAFAKATENAAPPQPGTALLLLARGDPPVPRPRSPLRSRRQGGTTSPGRDCFPPRSRSHSPARTSRRRDRR
jgi:hypothetical protein